MDAALRPSRAYWRICASTPFAATNNPAKCEALEAVGVRVHERVPVLTAPTPENYKYLRTKQDRDGASVELGDVRTGPFRRRGGIKKVGPWTTSLDERLHQQRAARAIYFPA